MRDGNPGLTDFRTLEPRSLSTLETRERTTFEEHSVYIFAARASVSDLNYSRLREANVPVLLLRARHSNRGMLRSQTGLVNGSRGYIVDIVWHANVTDPRTTLPSPDLPLPPVPYAEYYEDVYGQSMERTVSSYGLVRDDDP
ncbi:hypothetical protein E4U61_006001 [Claviceps capensis]|nr:hypothetical protein E4U61_006001 [Claviceps capensis]